MSKPNMPYQRLQRSSSILIAARGSSIDSFSLQDGSLLSTWTNTPPKPPPSSSSPPAKRRKISNEDDEDLKDEPKAEETQDPTSSAPSKKEKKKQNNRSDAVASGLESPAIIALAVTEDGKHVIAVTAEDKSIRVFENVLTEGGKQQLVQISLRQMPKRPCAITLTQDNKTIISADKFGDVYSLPLIPLPPSSTLAPQTPEPTAAPKAFTPAANELTIHSQRNRKALEHQRRQTNAAPEKPAFAGTLLLGHVSMLTDLILGRDGERNYILTADRDEHIRISRGIPQTHVIEGFCLGHEQFITRLCIPSSKENVLISGGGDDELYVWEWLAGKLVSKVDLKRNVIASMKESEEKKQADETSITVSGIFHTLVGLLDLVIVTCEGISGLFIFHLTSQNNLEYIQTIRLRGNALDVLVNITDSNRIIVSVDTIHKAGSTTEHRQEEGSVQPFHVFDINQDGKVAEVEGLVFAAGGETEEGNSGEGNLTNLLYNLENLRKREGEDKEE